MVFNKKIGNHLLFMVFFIVCYLYNLDLEQNIVLNNTASDVISDQVLRSSCKVLVSKPGMEIKNKQI